MAEHPEASTYSLQPGDSPILFSVPHAGTQCPRWLQERLTESAAQLPDTDWFVDRLFGFVVQRGHSLLVARNSRYLIDLNRPASGESLYPGQATTGLCPVEQFDGQPIYRDGEALQRDEIAQRTDRYWRPYHAALDAELERIQSKHGFAILFDCHSIDSVVPRLFDGTLPVLNLGTNHGTTAAPDLEQAVRRVLEDSEYSVAINGRFVGGTITRAHGRPEQGRHALQLEIGWQGYLDGTTWSEVKAEKLIAVLEAVVGVMEDWRSGLVRPNTACTGPAASG